VAERDDGDEGEGRGRLLSEGLRKVLGSGVNALFVTEEGVRSALGDLRLPKEALSFVAQQTEKTRRDLFGLMAKEVKSALGSANLLAELKKMLRDTKIQIRAEVTFTDAKPKSKAKARITRRKSARADDADDTGSTRRRR
jgi:hypothetical protein